MNCFCRIMLLLALVTLVLVMLTHLFTLLLMATPVSFTLPLLMIMQLTQVLVWPALATLSKLMSALMHATEALAYHVIRAQANHSNVAMR